MRYLPEKNISRVGATRPYGPQRKEFIDKLCHLPLRCALSCGNWLVHAQHKTKFGATVGLPDTCLDGLFFELGKSGFKIITRNWNTHSNDLFYVMLMRCDLVGCRRQCQMDLFPAPYSVISMQRSLEICHSEEFVLLKLEKYKQIKAFLFRKPIVRHLPVHFC